jgi:small-conductance mechanosensitive channel/CRP-like cAMP-binding protein
MGASIARKLLRVAALMAAPLGLLLLAILLRMEAATFASAWLTEPDARDSVETAAVVAVWVAGSWTLNRAVHLFVWQGLVRRRLKSSPPKVLVDLASLILWTLLLSLMLSQVFGQSLTGLLAASTVSLGVAGFALRELLSDVFAGIALSIERPFATGDWIEVDGVSGKVEEMTWRAVRLVSTEGITIMVPNGNIAGETFRNFSAPDNWFRDEIRVPLPFSVTTYQGRRILMSAVSQIEELAAYKLPPQVSIAEYTERAIVWRLLYWVPDYGRLSPLRFAVHQNIQRNMHFSGIYLPVPVEQVHVLRSNTAHGEFLSSQERMLRNTLLFRELEDEDLAHLVAAAQQRVVVVGQTIIRQGEDGASLFLLNEGLLSVSVATPDGVQTEVGQISPGNAFGEMSLLTGAARSATVTSMVDSLVTEIHRDAMAELLTARPQIAEILSRILAERQVRTETRVAANGQHAAHDEISVAGQFLARIRTFFNLPTVTAA